MTDSSKRARGDALDDRRSSRRDPRAEPENVPPNAQGSQPFKTPPESEMRKAAPKLSPYPTSDELISTPRPTESGPSLDGAGAGAAQLRRHIAVLQLELSVARAELENEREGRADDAEKMGTLLDRIASDDAVAQSLRDDLARERAFVEELRVSVQDKYADCNTLRQELATAEERLTARELDEAADRHIQTQRAERAERDLAEARKELEALRLDDVAKQAELEKVAVALKSANLKTFAANRQLEAWKSESSRRMEQTRDEHAKAMEELQREASAGLASAAKSLETIRAALVLPAPRPERLASSVPAPEPAPPSLAAPSRAPALPASPSMSKPTRPEIPAMLRKQKHPASTPSLEVRELDVSAEDLIEELLSKRD